MFFPFSFLVIPAQLVLDPIGERESRGGKEKELIFACAEMTEERKTEKEKEWSQLQNYLEM